MIHLLLRCPEYTGMRIQALEALELDEDLEVAAHASVLQAADRGGSTGTPQERGRNQDAEMAYVGCGSRAVPGASDQGPE